MDSRTLAIAYQRKIEAFEKNLHSYGRLLETRDETDSKILNEMRLDLLTSVEQIRGLHASPEISDYFEMPMEHRTALLDTIEDGLRTKDPNTRGELTRRHATTISCGLKPSGKAARKLYSRSKPHR
jgi:hypothetical protein